MTEPFSIFTAGNEPEWLKSAFSQKIFKALGDDTIRFVGGAVRDSIVDLPVSDVDMATTHKPETVMLKLKAEGIKVIPTGVAHGTVTAIYKGEAREITTLRVDVETDGRHAAVAYTDDWQQDAARRDFTINALYLDGSGLLYDAFDGLRDLKARRVCFIGDAAARIQEDGLRILRFYRFSSRYADQIDPAGQQACAENKHQVDHLSVERVRDELLKLLSGDNPVTALQAMASAGVLARIFGQQHSLDDLLNQIKFDQDTDTATTALTRLWLTAGENISPKNLADMFKLSGAQRKGLLQLNEARKVSGETTSNLVHKLIYLYGPVIAQDAAQLMQNTGIGSALHKEIEHWPVPRFPVSAKDLLANGYEAGPALGVALKKLENRWIASDFSLSKKELLRNLP